MNLLRTHMKLACVAGLAALGLILGGCSKDDDGGKKGAAGFVYPAVPTARPTFTGLTSVLDAHGGDGSSGNNGGSGGDITARALHGRVLHGDKRSKPAVNANVLTTAELADNTVSYAELLALAGAQVVTSGSTTTIDLFGLDFYLPSTATLNISGAPGTIFEVVIRVNFPGDVIRIDGNVNGVRLTADSVGLSLLSEQSTGTAICVDGNVDLSGYPSSIIYAGGTFRALAYRGATVVRGTVNTTGNSPSAGSGGSGGDILIGSDEGDVVIPFGILNTSGGFGVNGGSGGDIEVQASDTELMNFDWALRTFGGPASSQGGSGGNIFVRYEGPLNAFCIFEAFSGSATSGSSQVAGDVFFQGLTIQGVVSGSATGGNGGTGNDGGNIDVLGESVFGLAVEVSANGGTGSTGSGGNAGTVSVYCDGAAMVNVLVNAQTRGGQGAFSGGAGGNVDVGGYGETNNVDVTDDTSGGQGGTGSGGNAGSCTFYQSSSYGESIVNSSVVSTQNGGNGVAGGSGGDFTVTLSGGQRNDFTLSITSNGGNGTSGTGAAGGDFSMTMSDLASANIDISGSFNGGSTNSANGTGSGGTFFVSMNGQCALTLNGGTMSMRGGLNNGVTAGGIGGQVDISGGFASEYTTNTVNWDLRGGDSNGGQGGAARALYAYRIGTQGQVQLIGGSINAVGGRGSATSGTSGGGNGGRVQLVTQTGRMLMNTSIDTSGGPGSASATGGNAQTVVITCAASDLQVTANITANGVTGAGAGLAANISINGDATTNILITSTINSNGGGGSTAGAAGGTIAIGSGIEAKATFNATASVHANGGATTGAAGTININLAGTAGAGITEVAGSLLETRNGAGTLVPANILRNP